MMNVLYAPLLQAASGVTHAFFTRDGGVSEGVYESLNCGILSDDAQAAVEENRARVAIFLGAKPESLALCKQVHGTRVVTVEHVWGEADRPEADAMVTKQPGIALGILTADCVPVLFADDQARVIGAAHAGWQGALAGVVQRTIEAMEALGARRDNIRAAIGPCIWQDSYEVGPAFPRPFLAQDPSYQRFFRPAVREGHFMFDLPGYVAALLAACGVLEVEPSPADTCADGERFFSYRRCCLDGSGKTGRLLSALMLHE